MPIPRPLAALILLAPLGAQTVVIQPAPGVKATEVRTVALAPNAPLRVRNVNGHIRVTVWDRNEVEFTGAFRPGADKAQVKVVLEPKDGGLEVRGEYPKNSDPGPGVEMDLKVPRSAMPYLETVNGAVDLRDVTGKATCKTVNGSITLEHLAEALKAETVNGSIKGKGLTGAVTAKTVNGGITLSAQGLSGRLEASTLNGELRIKGEGSKDVKVSKRHFEASFGTGSQVLELKTLNGDITVD